MKEEQMLKCLIAFILGWLVSRMMGNGFMVGCNNHQGWLDPSRPQHPALTKVMDFFGIH